MQQYNCQVGQSWFDVCTNTYGTLDYIGKLLNDNNASLDVFPFTGQQIQWDNTIVKDSSVQALISANGYVFNTGNNISNKIQSYTAGTSTIDFTNNGGDDWNIDFKITPDTVQSTANIVGYQYRVAHWISGVETVLESGFKTTDYSYNAVGNGAGVYNVFQTFVFDDSSFLRINRLVKVDASGNIIASISLLGSTVNSTNGLVIDITANVIQSGVNYPILWGSFDTFPPTSLNVLGTTTTINAQLPINSIGIGYQIMLQSVFTNDFTDNNGSASAITIS